MRAALLILLLLFLWSCTPVHPEAVPSAAQPTSVLDAEPPSWREPVYSNVIAEYVAAMTKRDGSFPDTLYINRHADFPDIELPAVIAGRSIGLIDPSEAETAKGGEDFACLNIIGWFNDGTVEFQVIRFEQDFRHRPDGRDDCRMYYSMLYPENTFVLDSLRF